MKKLACSVVAVICALVVSIPSPTKGKCVLASGADKNDCQDNTSTNRITRNKIFKYPAVTPLFDIPGPSSGLRVPFFLSSEDGRKITLNYTKYGSLIVNKSTLQLELESNQIISWKASFLGKDNTAAITAVAVGALLFWPALIAAPFLSHNITGFEINYIDKLGIESSIFFATTAPSTLHLQFLENTTGLKMGETRDSTDIQELYEAGLSRLAAQHLDAQKKVYQFDSRKPWCTVLNPSASKEDIQSYKKVDNQFKKLRNNLGMSITEPVTGTTIEENWNQYVMKNENFSKWVNANPDQAAKLKACKTL